MSNSFQQFGFGKNDAGIGSRVTKFKAEKGKTYRLSFVWWNGMEEDGFNVSTITPDSEDDEASITPKFIGAPRHYHKDVGYVINKGPEYSRLLGSDPQTKIATIIVSWPLLKNGKPDMETLLEEMPKVMPWVIGQDKYEKLKKMHSSGYPMHDWDVQADCEDAQFQKLGFLPARQNMFKEMMKSDKPKMKEMADYIIDRVRAIAPKLGAEIGQDLSIDQIKEKLGLETSGPVGDVVTSDSDVDGLLGSMLDD